MPSPSAGRRRTTPPAAPEEQLWAVADLLRSRLDPTEARKLVLAFLYLRAAGEPVDVDHLDRLRATPDLAPALPTRAALTAAIVGLASSPGTLFAPTAPRHDLLGRVYEYFLDRFARQEGRGGEYYTPAGVVRLLVAMLRPSGTVYDPCCGSGGMFVQAAAAVPGARFVGQELNPATRALALLNLSVHGLAADLAPRPADALHEDLHPTLRADAILANPPFNVSSWGAPDPTDPRWALGLPPVQNANYAWLLHILAHLAPTGRAAVVLANGSLTSRSDAERDLRRGLVEGGHVEAIVSLPEQLFYTTPIPACVWVLTAAPRRDGILFVDGRELGTLEARSRRVLGDADIARVAALYADWRAGRPVSVPGFAASAPLDVVRAQDFQLTPGRYAAAHPAAAHPTPATLGAPAEAALRAELLRLLDERAVAEAAVRRLLGG
jgi:type I restriction enzyme M protein